MFKANWFYDVKRKYRLNSNGYHKCKKKKQQMATHPYNWNHWKAPELLRVEKALKEHGPPNLLPISAIDKHFESLINKAKQSS